MDTAVGLVLLALPFVALGAVVAAMTCLLGKPTTRRRGAARPDSEAG